MNYNYAIIILFEDKTVNKKKNPIPPIRLATAAPTHSSQVAHCKGCLVKKETVKELKIAKVGVDNCHLRRYKMYFCKNFIGQGQVLSLRTNLHGERASLKKILGKL